MQRKRELLEEHGTKGDPLPASAIIGAARADLERRKRNIVRGRNGDGGYEHYAFLRQHVVRASSVVQLLEISLTAAVKPGEKLGTLAEHSAKKASRLIYSDYDHLRFALAMAKIDEPPQRVEDPASQSEAMQPVGGV